MKKMLRWMLICIVLIVGITGCITSTDPATGEKQISVDPNVAAQIEVGTQATVSILTILGAFWPILIPIGTGIAAGFGTWVKVKPKLTQAQSEATMYHSATESIVMAIEDFKEKYPEEWDKLKAECLHTIGTNTENIIRALRDLPPKE